MTQIDKLLFFYCYNCDSLLDESFAIKKDGELVCICGRSATLQPLSKIIDKKKEDIIIQQRIINSSKSNVQVNQAHKNIDKNQRIIMLCEERRESLNEKFGL